jgi:excisionase family DNA binding protein
MESIEIEKRLISIEQLLLSQKNALTFDEGAVFTGISKSHLYKMTSAGAIPHYKPRGKMIYFDRAELENWLLQNRVATAEEIEAKASSYDAQYRRRGAR